MSINEKYVLMKKILTKDIVKHHLMTLKEAGMFGNLPMSKQLANAISLHLPIMILLDLIHRNPEEMDAIGRSCHTLCARVAMPIVKDFMIECNYIWPKFPN